jgi:hypothetical protein
MNMNAAHKRSKNKKEYTNKKDKHIQTKKKSHKLNFQKKPLETNHDKITNVLSSVWGNAYISTQVIPRMTCECFDLYFNDSL